MRPVQPTLTRPYGIRVDIGRCPEAGHPHCLVLIHTPCLTPDGVFLSGMASTYEHLVPEEAADIIDLLTQQVADTL